MDNSVINIAISISDSFVMPARVMLYSLFSKASRKIRVFLLYNFLSAENRDLLRQTAEGSGNSFEEIFIDEKWFSGASLNRNPLYSIEIYYRIMLPYLTEVDKILWLDADIVVTDDIAKLYDNDISDRYIAAVIDIGEEKGSRDEIKKKLGIEEQVYFNSGVILFNNKKIREEIPKEDFFEAINRFNDILVCPDQDILNYVLGKNFLDLPIYYNYQHHTDGDCDETKGMILHYIWKKPWNSDYPGYLDKPFWDNAVSCGFKREYKKYRIGKKAAYLKGDLLPAVTSRLKRGKK